MSIDVNRFRTLFFEESIEGLGIMESGLLSLSNAVKHNHTADPDLINEVFRATHSIKGGSGMFGFTELGELTHLLETLLDELRSDNRSLTLKLSKTLLESVDCLRAMLQAGQSGNSGDPLRLASATRQLRAALQQQLPAVNGVSPAIAPQPSPMALNHWNITFRPHTDLLRTANDPLRLLKELGAMGDLELIADTSAVPPLSVLEPEDCYLSWTGMFTGTASRSQIKEVFEWVEGDCELEIEHKVESGEVAPPAELASASASQPAAAAKKDPAVHAPKPVESASIRVSTDKVDVIINLVGELVITQSMLNRFGEHFEMHMLDKLRDGLALLERNTRELQENVLKIRMLPISSCFSRFPRLVHDLADKLGKNIALRLTGEQTELDKTVLEKLSDPLIHLVRNSLDHGIESPEERRESGKPDVGTVHLHAAHEGGNIVVEVSDDGAGLNTARILKKARSLGLVSADEQLPDEKIYDLLFLPGFSTAEQISEISGRGVGMDVVKRNVQELGGRIDITTRPGKGTTFHIRLPLTLAILDGQLVRVSDQTFVIPLVSIAESIQMKKTHAFTLAGGAEVYRLRDEYIPVIRLYQSFNLHPVVLNLEQGLLVVVEADGKKAGIFVDDLLAQQQVVIKSIETNFRKVNGVSGATILGDGTVALILDVPGILAMTLRPHAGLANRQETYEYSN